MSPPVVIRCLGPLDVERAGARVPIGSAMQRRLLTSLVIARGETVSTDRLVAALWGDEPPTSARNSLQTYVARLRDALGGRDTITHRPPGYALDRTLVTVDVWSFHGDVQRARRMAAEAPAEAAALLRTTLASWRGDAYGEFADDLAREAAVQVEELRSEATELLARAHLRTDDPAAAVAALDEHAETSSLREPTVLLRAQALAAAGRLPDALAAIRDHRQRLAEELGLDASPALDDLEQRLLRGEVSAPGASVVGPRSQPAAPPPIPIPRPPTATVGRHAELARIGAALEASSLVTLVGPGGVGKTRLAALVGGAAGGGAWVDLAPVRGDRDVAAAFVDALGLTVSGGAEIARAVADRLARSASTLVVDNCEHVLDAAAALLEAVLSRSREVRIVATSRERLDVPGELVVPVAPLGTPSRHGATSDDPAVRLFLDRLVEAGGAPVPPADAADVIAAVGGLPLGIELAAARAASLPVTDLLERLHHRLDVLDASRRRGQRHRTLEGVIRWSYDLLEPATQALFRRLSVFTATFALTDAERVCADETLAPAVVAPELARLVEVSMVLRLEDARFRLLEPLRLFAASLLAEEDEADAVHERQRQVALHLTGRADADVSGPHETAIVEEVELALPDLRAVHDRALRHHDLATVAQMAAQLYRYAYLRARSDILTWGGLFADGAGADVPTDDRARALAASATGAWMAGDLTRAAERAAAAAPLADGSWSRITTAEVAGDVALALGDLDAAVVAFRENRALAEEVGHVGLAAQAAAGLAFALHQQGDDGAGATAEAALRRANESGAPSVRSLAEYTLGEVLADEEPGDALAAFDRARTIAIAAHARFHEGLARTADVALRGRYGPPDEALQRYRLAIELWRDSGAEGLLLTALRNLVVLLVRTGADAAALELHAVVERLAVLPSYGDEARRLDAAVTAARERLGPASGVITPAGAMTGDLRSAADLALRMIARVPAGRHDTAAAT